ncbi:hypothetical protein DsansV1_C18g0154111 [Dioscorea sansibarensis]
MDFNNKTLPKALNGSTSLALPLSPSPPMAAVMPTSASPPLPIPPHPIFIDTNLDTHLAMGIFWDDTVADLKRKVRMEHVLCFPDIGEITVRAIKVRREATVYNLSDLMLVRSAFNGINGAWFLIVDATPASVIQHQAGSADCIATVNNGLPRNHNQFQTEPNSCSLPNHLVLVDKDNVPEKLTLPNDKDVESDHMELGVEDKHGECGMPLQGLEQRPGHDVAVSAEPVNESNELAVPNAPHTIGLLVDQLENDTREEECGNSDVSIDGELTPSIAVKKVNAKKRKSLLQNDQAENIPVEKKKLKEGKDESSGKPFDDSGPTKNLEASHYSEKPSINTSKASLPEKHKENPASLETSANEALQCNLPSTENPDNREKKKKKRSSKPHSEAEFAVPANAAETKSPSKMGKESTQTGLADEALANEAPHGSHPLTENTDNREKKKKKRSSKLYNEVEPVVPSKAVDTRSKMGKTSAETSLADELLDMNDASASLQNQVSEVIHVDTNHSVTVRDFSGMVPPGPLSSKLDDNDCMKGGLPEARLPDQPLSKEPVIKEKPADPSESSHANLNDKSNATTAHIEFDGYSDHAEAKSELLTKLSHTKKKTKSKKAPNKIDASPEEAAGNNYNDKNSSMPTKLENTDCFRQDLSKIILPDHPLSEPATEDKPADPSDSKYANLNKKSNAATAHKERDGHSHHMEDITEPATKSSHKKKKTTKKEQNKIDAPSEVGEEKTLEEAVKKSDNDQSRESHAVILGEGIADDRNYTKQGSEDLSHAKVRRSNQRKKTELPDQQPKQFQTPIDPDAQALEENSLGDQQNSRVEAFKRAISNETAAPRSDSAPLVLKGKKTRGSKKKSSKVDLYNHEAPVDEYVDTAEVNDEGMLEATRNSLGKDSKMATVNGEAISLETPAEVHGRRSRLQKKKSEKTTEETTKGSLLDAHDDFGKEAACDISHNADHGLIQDDSLTNSVEKALNNVPSEIDGEPLENDVVDFMKHFIPKVSQNESAEPQELAPTETETRKPHKEKTTRKRKLNSHPKDYSNKVDSLMSNEHHLHQSKPEETNFALHDLADLAEQLSEKGHKSNNSDNEKTKEDAGKPEVSHGNNSPKRGSPSKLHKKIEKKLKEPRSGMVHDLLTRDEQNVHEEYPTGKLPVSGSNAKSLPYSESNDFTKPKTASTGILSAPVNQTRTGVDSDISLKEGVADQVASDDSTEGDTSYQKKRYKVAVRKIPSKRYAKLMGNSRQKNGVQATSSTIFDDTVSGSSDDDAFEFRTRKSTLEDNSFTSADSDGDYMNTPGVVSAAHDKNIKESDADGFNLSQSSNTARKSMPLSSILKSSSSYRKVKLTSSQSQPEDSENQPVDMVLETQPDE